MQWVEQRLVDGWRDWWKRWSVRLAAAAGTLSALLVANQALVLSLLSYLPKDGFARVLIAVSIGIVVFLVPTVAVLLKQQKLSD